MPGAHCNLEGEANVLIEHKYEATIANAMHMNYRMPEEYLRDRTTGIMLMRGWLKLEDLPEWYMDATKGPPTAEEEDALEAKYGHYFDDPVVQESLNTYYPLIWTEKDIMTKMEELHQLHIEPEDQEMLEKAEKEQKTLPEEKKMLEHP